MKKILLTITFVFCALSLLAARPQPNLKQRLQETNAPTATPIPLDTATPIPLDTDTPDYARPKSTLIPTDSMWRHYSP